MPRVVDAIWAGGRQVLALTADVAQEEGVVHAFADAERGLGSVGALVNAAGMGYNAQVELLEATAVTRLLAVNVLGTMVYCREAAHRMSTLRDGREPRSSMCRRWPQPSA